MSAVTGQRRSTDIPDWLPDGPIESRNANVVGYGEIQGRNVFMALFTELMKFASPDSSEPLYKSNECRSQSPITNHQHPSAIELYTVKITSSRKSIFVERTCAIVDLQHDIA